MLKQPKVFGLGFQKTGTSTLRDALKILGYKVKDNTTRPLIPILKGDFKKVFSYLDGFDAAEDTPWYILYKELDRHFPGSKFVLTIRDSESWYKSVSRHIGTLRDASHEWVYGRGKGCPIEDKENTLKVYDNHNQSVKEYFKDRPRDLLVIDFTKGQGWTELCEFLGTSIPDENIPHTNNSKERKKRSKLSKWWKHNRKQFKNNLKIWYIDLRKLW